MSTVNMSTAESAVADNNSSTADMMTEVFLMFLFPDPPPQLTKYLLYFNLHYLPNSSLLCFISGLAKNFSQSILSNIFIPKPLNFQVLLPGPKNREF